jgi:hypothetical protein
MTKKFECRREVVIPASPEQVWDAVTENTGGWLWPIEYEPGVGGAGPWGSTITAWEPPNHFANHASKEDWFNTLDYQIEPHEGGCLLRYVHAGVFVDNWDTQYDGVAKHTDFYLHTLSQYVRYFAGRTATYVTADGPDASNSRDGFTRARTALGVEGKTSGATVTLDLPGIGHLEATIDYLVPEFVGLRTADALYCFFGRNAFGAPVGLGHHLFGPDTDQPATQDAWQTWLNGLY